MLKFLLNMLDAFQSKLLETHTAHRTEIIKYFEALNRGEAMASSARERLLEALYSGAPFETVGIQYLESINRASQMKDKARERLLKTLKNSLAEI